VSHQTIEKVIYAYATAIDAGDFAAVAELFRQGKICTSQSEAVGYAAVLNMYQTSTALYENGTPCTQHITSNLSIDIEGNTALCHSYFTVMQALPDFPLQAIISGHYEDVMACAEGCWQFRERRIVPTLLGDLSRHLLFDLTRLQK